MHPKYSPVSCKYLPCPGAVHLPLSMFTALLPITDPFCSSQLYSSMRIPGLHGNNTGGERERIVNKRTEKNSTIICRDRSDNRRVWFRKQRKYSFLNCNRETKTISSVLFPSNLRRKKMLVLLFDFEEKRERKKERKGGQKTGRYSRDYGNSYRKEAGGGRRNIPRKYRRYKSYPFDGVGF